MATKKIRNIFDVDPVKQIKSSGSSVTYSAMLTPPSIVTMKSWSRYLSVNFLIALLELLEISDGFTMTQFPAEIACISGFKVVTRGAFQEPTTATTPSGSYNE